MSIVAYRQTGMLPEFVARKQEKLESFKQQNVLSRLAELEAAQNQADSNRPGYEPSDMFLNRTDFDAVERHNKKVQKHNNQIDLQALLKPE